MKKKHESAFSARQYMLSEDYEIFYYNDKSPSNVARHRHDYYEFYLFLEGHVSMSVEEQSLPLSQGSILVIPPNVSHHLVIHDREVPYRRFVFWISARYADSLMQSLPDADYIFKEAQKKGYGAFRVQTVAFNELQATALRVIEESRSSRFGSRSFAHIYISDLLMQLNRAVYEQTHTTPVEEHAVYQNVSLFIRQHLDEPLTLDRLASEFYLSKYHIAHLFKEHLGISVHQYILKHRLEACRDAIMGPDSIQDIALSRGFSDYTAFYRAFTKEYGMSPMEYRKLHSLSDPGSL